MGIIKNNVFQLLLISIVLSLSSLLVSKRFSKSFELLSGAVLALFILTSLASVIDVMKETKAEGPSNDTNIDEDDGGDAFIKDISGELCREISRLIQSRFSIEGDAIKVSVTVDREENGEVILKAVSVKLDFECSAELAADIADYVSDVTAAPCTVFQQKADSGVP